MSSQWVLYDGSPFASALVLSHDEQLDRLEKSAPEALPVAVVAGDPCFDRMVASTNRRGRYREALGIGDRRLVVVSSTWGAKSAFGSWPGLVRRLLGELSMDSWQVALALHPNTWHGHGPWQIRSWLADCLRSGLVLLPEIDGWRTGLIAGDVVVGDHGSVTGYGAALGVPTILAAFPDDEIALGSPIAALGETAPRLDPAFPLRPQIDKAMHRWTPSTHAKVAGLVTSAAGEALHRLRTTCYAIMDVPEPDGEPPVLPLRPVPTDSAGNSAVAFRAEHRLDEATRTLWYTRFPAEVKRDSDPLSQNAADTHICCPIDYPHQGVRAVSAVLTCPRPDLPTEEHRWLRTTLDHHPSCEAAAILDEDRCVIRFRSGTQVTLSSRRVPPDVLASSGYAWYSCAVSAPEVPRTLRLELDSTPHRVEVAAG